MGTVKKRKEHIYDSTGLLTSRPEENRKGGEEGDGGKEGERRKKGRGPSSQLTRLRTRKKLHLEQILARFSRGSAELENSGSKNVLGSPGGMGRGASWPGSGTRS